MILFIKGLAPSSLPNVIRCFVSGRVFSISADLYAHQKTLIWPLQFHSRWWLIHCWGVNWVEIAAAESPTWPFVMLLVSPLTSLPSAVSTSVYEQVSSLSPSETAILCRQRRCCNDCFLLIRLLLSRRLLLLHIVVISHNSIRIYNWSIRGQEVRYFLLPCIFISACAIDVARKNFW
jgi:hypothetical protein